MGRGEVKQTKNQMAIQHRERKKNEKSTKSVSKTAQKHFTTVAVAATHASESQDSETRGFKPVPRAGRVNLKPHGYVRSGRVGSSQ